MNFLDLSIIRKKKRIKNLSINKVFIEAKIFLRPTYVTKNIDYESRSSLIYSDYFFRLVFSGAEQGGHP